VEDVTLGESREQQQSSPQPRGIVEQITPCPQPSSGRRTKLRLDANENTVGAPPHVLDFMKRYLSAVDLSIYPEYDHALEDLSDHFSVARDELILTNGTDDAIRLLMTTYVDPGSEALLLRPSDPIYKFHAQLAGARIGEIEYRSRTLAFPMEELLERVSDSTRIVVLPNPGSPTGTGTAAPAIEELLAKAPHAVVLVDEAYYEFSGVTMLPAIPNYRNLFVTRSFSAIYGLAGLRCACLFSQSGNIADLRKIQSPYSVNSLAAMAVRIALQDHKFIEDYALEVLTARELLYVGFERLSIPYVRTQANFVLFEAGARSAEITDALAGRGILVHDCRCELPGYVRVTLGTRDQVQQFLNEMEQIW